MPIQGRMTRERERLAGMTPEERKWRGKYCSFHVRMNDGSSYYIIVITNFDTKRP